MEGGLRTGSPFVKKTERAQFVSAACITNILLILLLPVLLLGLTKESSLTGRALVCRPLLWGGEISYSLFVSYYLAQMSFKILPAHQFFNAPLQDRWLVLGIYALTVLAFGLALHHLVALFVIIPARHEEPVDFVDSAITSH